MGERRKRQQLLPGDWPKVVHRYLSGHDAETIARDFGCTGVAVKRAIRQYLGHCGELMAGFGIATVGFSAVDPRLGSRVSRALIGFIEALDAARRAEDETSLQKLHDSSDQLMRAIARLRIELARSAWRH